MIDWLSAEMLMREQRREFSGQDPGVFDLMRALKADRAEGSVRRRVAGLIVRLGLRLDPGVALAVPIRLRA